MSRLMGGLFNKKKGQTMLYKTNQYYEYMELFKKDDCPVCLIMDEWLDNFLEEFLYECVNDRSMRRRIMETGGFCPKHAKAMMGKGDPLGHSIIYTVLIDDYIKNPDAKKKEGCLVCDLEIDAERRSLNAFLNFFGESEEFSNAFRETKTCICRPHLKKMKKLTRNKDLIKKLSDVQNENLTHAKGCLDEIIRKHDYHYTDEQLTDEERLAWQRAVKLMSGVLK